jgi:hypothetical protein
MRATTHQINVTETEGSSLPLGYQKMLIKKIPSEQIDKKISKYNRKYNHLTFQAIPTLKPISKIVTPMSTDQKH